MSIFQHSIARRDPLQDLVILWTRVTVPILTVGKSDGKLLKENPFDENEEVSEVELSTRA